MAYISLKQTSLDILAKGGVFSTADTANVDKFVHVNRFPLFLIDRASGNPAEDELESLLWFVIQYRDRTMYANRIHDSFWGWNCDTLVFKRLVEGLWVRQCIAASARTLGPWAPKPAVSLKKLFEKIFEGNL